MKPLKLILCLVMLTSMAFASQTQKSPSFSYGFIENKGQIIDQNNQTNNDVKYLFNNSGLNIQLKDNSFSYDSYLIERGNCESPIIIRDNCIQSTTKYSYHRIDIEFIGANKSPELVASDPNIETYNYYTIGTKMTEVLGVKAFKKVKYINLYDGIDLEFIVNEKNQPKYNFIVKPGANANQIKWKYNGAHTNVTEGKVIIETVNGKIEESIPYSFTNDSAITIEYNLIDDGEWTFSIPRYSANSKLIIDPAPWATYLGGDGDDWAHGIVTDKFGNVFVVGETNSANNIATNGAYQTIITGTSNDGFLTKYNSSGVKQWSTYYGGSSNDVFNAVATDTFGNIIGVGFTVSTSNIATTGAYQSTHGSNGNGSDGFIVKFSTNGTRIWGTYYGGGSSDNILSIATDKLGNINVTGYTNSTNGIASLNAFQANFNTLQDGFVARFSPSGIRTWGTYFGGNNIDGGYDVAADTSCNIVVSGYTVSNNGISTPGAFQQTYGGGNCDAIIFKFDSVGNRLWSTYYGGSDLEHGYTLKTDKNNNIIIAGTTWSQNNIATNGAYQTSVSNGFDGFISKFNPSGTRIWGTYYGSSGYYDYVLGLDVDTLDNIFITGYTNSTTGFSTLQAHQTTLGGSNDAFLTKFTSSGTRVWSTYYGGQGDEQAEGICIDNSGNPVIAGKTTSNSQMSFNNSGQTTIGLGLDAFVAAITTVGVLPVKMIYFKASLINEISNLEWQTASETNNKEFIIERSTNNYDWSVIGVVGGQGNSFSMNIYKFVDLNTPKNTVIYYRLKQVDFDGQYSYSHIETITPIELTTNTLSVFPNPTIDFLNIKGANTRIEIYNTLGIKILDLDSDSIIDISGLENGIYFVVSGSQKTKFIKR